jgi:energy-coupling factor transport system ATP-binding protein
VDGFQASDKRGRRKVGILFQHPSRQLFEQTVFEDIAFGPKNYGIKGKKLENTVYEAAKLANLRKEVLTASPRKLSGGEQKLACFAGIIACSPDYIILDEPFAGVDSASCEKLAEAIRQLKSAGCGVLIVSHQPDIFPGLVDRILYLEEGKLRFDGSLESFAGIDPLHSPSVPALMIRLRTKGMDVSTTVFSAKEALEEILFACGIGK